MLSGQLNPANRADACCRSKVSVPSKLARCNDIKGSCHFFVVFLVFFTVLDRIERLESQWRVAFETRDFLT